MTASPELEGLLPVDKPVGPTSHDVVARARRALGLRRIGHTGTLDPFASGLLLLCLGRATRIAEYLATLPKRYAAVMRLGQATDTDDLTGSVIAESDTWRAISEADLRSALDRRRGPQLQVPPAYSAKKQEGVRLYEKARRGEIVAAEAAAVEIYELRLVSWDPPHARFETTSSTGTYIRAIARDVGAELGTHAHLVELRRTAIGPWRAEAATPLESLSPESARASLIPPLEALAHLPRVDVDAAGSARIRHGRAVETSLSDAPAAAVAFEGALLAVARVEGGWARPRKVLLDA